MFRKGAIVAVSSPRLISMAIGRKVDAEALGGWRVHSRDGVAGEAARLVLNLPAPQVLALLEPLLLGGVDDLEDLKTAAEKMRRVAYAPCRAPGAGLAPATDAAGPARGRQNPPCREGPAPAGSRSQRGP